MIFLCLQQTSGDVGLY